MKKIILFTCGLLFSLTLLAQPPQGINYQAVVRNSSGELVSNQTVNFRFNFRTGSAAGTIVYTEIQDITTDEYGLASLVIGNGIPVSGTFENINWKDGNIWIEVEMDPANTYTYVSMGAEQFQSVPYALYSGSDWKTSEDNLYYNDGNVGIGTDTPTEKLEVVGDVFINNNDLGVEQSIFLGPSSPTISIGREAGSRTMLLKSGVDGIVTGAGFKFLINDEDKLILDEDGNLGIGTLCPDEKLHVAGKVKIEEMDIGSATDSLVTWNPADSTLRVVHVDSIKPKMDAIADVDGDTRIQLEASPDEDVIHFDMAGTEFFQMDGGRFEVFNTGSSVFMGEGAGASDDFSDNNNVAIGNYALNHNSIGEYNTATGFHSLFYNSEGSNNTANGAYALQYNMTGYENTAAGVQSLYSNTDGSFNTAVGTNSLKSMTSGSFNTAVGTNSLMSMTSGSYNTAIGFGSLESYTYSNYNTVIGYMAGADDAVNSTAIGAYSYVAGSDNLVLGSIAGTNGATSNTQVGIGISNPSNPLDIYSNTPLYYHPNAIYHIRLKVPNGYWQLGMDNQAGDADLYFRSSEETGGYTAYVEPGSGQWKSTSDRRLKKNIQPLTNMLEKIQLLQPVSYLRINQDENEKLEIGFIAQDVYEVLPENRTAQDKNGSWALGYADFGVIAIAGIKELKAEKDKEIEELKLKNEELESRLATLEQMMAEYNSP